MATPTVVARSSARIRRKLVRGLAAAVLVLVIGVALLATWFLVATRRALPQIDGTIATAGLSAPVNVVRDQHGVPHITASNLNDLFFAQGYVTAQDRLWQMDMLRRYAGGELAEVLGKKLVKSDERQRTLMLRYAAELGLQTLTPEVRGYAEAYARGVNAYIDSHRSRLPVEFRVLRYEPRPWRVEDSMLLGVGLSDMLTEGLIEHELGREKISARVGPELAADLYPNASGHDHPPIDENQSLTVYSDQTVSTELRKQPSLRAPPRSESNVETPLLPGSNNWVISGAHTASGKPLLSNDMHLPHTIPNIWYEAHLHAGEYDVAGVTLPGLPFIVVGHNERIAWGFTNLGPAVQDLYIETFNSNGEYQTPDGWGKPQHRREVIHVKGGKDIELDVLVTRHGPIVSRLIPGESRQLAMKWTIYQPGTIGMPLFDLNRARNWDEFRTALSHLGSPGQNVVFADVDGHIGYHATGFAPTRADGSNPLPVPGNDNAHEWTGYIPFEQMPHTYDPPTGIIATANGRVTPDDYPYVISNEWESPWRTNRIYRYLGADKKFQSQDMLALQTDVYSDFDRFTAERFVYAIDHARQASPKVKQAAEILRNWNGQMTTDSAAAVIVTSARTQLTRMLLSPKLGADVADYRWFMESIWLENVLLNQPARWLPPGYDTYDDLLAAAMDKALTRTGNPASDRWGKVSKIFLQHPVFGSIPFLRRWTGPGEHPQSGDGFTVKQVGRTFGPSERMTVDFSNLDNSTLNVVTGQSGNFLSPYYMDQWRAWYDGTTFTLPFTDAAVQKNKAHELTLVPQTR
jgi:penicillin amidase